MEKSMQSTLLNAQVCKAFFVRYRAAAAPCHSFPKVQVPLLNYEEGRHLSTMVSLESPLLFVYSCFFPILHKHASNTQAAAAERV